MQGRFFFQWFVLISLFIIALVMEIAPWPAGFQGFKPAWLVLILLYWVLAVPRKVNIGCAFTLGLVWDLVLGSTLGIHALVLSVFTYFIALNSQFISVVAKSFSYYFYFCRTFGCISDRITT